MILINLVDLNLQNITFHDQEQSLIISPNKILLINFVLHDTTIPQLKHPNNLQTPLNSTQCLKKEHDETKPSR